jgi:hypothetical protein
MLGAWAMTKPDVTHSAGATPGERGLTRLDAFLTIWGNF